MIGELRISVTFPLKVCRGKASTVKEVSCPTATFFFPVHYGGFHLGYLVFLAFLIPPTDPEAVLLGGAVFLITHGISFIKHYMTEEFDIQKEFMMPYLRIIPMHLTIIFGGMLMVFGVHVIVMIFFMALKTGADVAAHLIKHKQWNGFVRVLP